MDWSYILTIIGILSVVIALFNFNVNKRIDDLKELFKAELKPINQKLDNHITDTDKKIEKLDVKIQGLEKKMESVDRKTDEVLGILKKSI